MKVNLYIIRISYINFCSKFIIGDKLFQYVLSTELNAQILVIGMVLHGRFRVQLLS